MGRPLAHVFNTGRVTIFPLGPKRTFPFEKRNEEMIRCIAKLSFTIVLSSLIIISALPCHAGSLVFWGDSRPGLQSVPSGSFKAVSIAQLELQYYSQEFAVAIRDDGTLVGWGNNDYGQTNVPSGTFTHVACSSTQAYGLRTDGTLVAWGYNLHGSLNVPSGTFKAISAGESGYGLGLRTDGTVVGWGYGQNGNTLPGIFTAIAANDYISVGLSTDGTLVDLLGSPFVLPSGKFTAIAAGPFQALGIRDDDTLDTWGYRGNDAPSGTFSKIVTCPRFLCQGL
jgi:alpha-tubulin suppressor-like RCC1 family protein